MADSQFLRMQKLSGPNIVEIAARHNHREIAIELGHGYNSAIDLSRVGLNYVLRGASSAAGVAREARELMQASGVGKLRKDAVLAIEIIFSLNPGSLIDERQYFSDSLTWCEAHFGAPVISAVVHLDEGAPHCHLLILPLVGGRMVGSDLMGYKSKLQAAKKDFNDNVGSRYGFSYSSTAVRLSGEKRKEMATAAVGKLFSDVRLMGLTAVRDALIELISAKPEKLHAALQGSRPAFKKLRRAKTFVEIMTAPT